MIHSSTTRRPASAAGSARWAACSGAAEPCWRSFSALAGLLASGFAIVAGLFCMNLLSPVGWSAALPVAGYASAAIAMVGPAHVFERRGSLTRSLHLLHGALGRMLGRLLLIALVLAGGGVLELVAFLSMGVVSAAIVSALVHVALTVVLFSGILVTYAECRGAEGYTTGDLVRQLQAIGLHSDG